MFNLLRRLINPLPSSHRKRSCVLRLECLEGREIPSIAPVSFGGDLMKGGVHSFPAQAKDLPSGTTIKVFFGGSPDPTGKFKAAVALKDPNGVSVKSNPSVAITTEKLLFTYPLKSKTSGQFVVDVKNAGKVTTGIYRYFGKATITLPDIAVTGGKYIGGKESERKNPTGVEATYTITTDFKENFKIGLYRSADGKTASGAALKEVDVTGDGKTGAKTVTLDTKTPLRGSDAEPFLVIVADKDKKVEEENEANNVSKLSLPNVGLKIVSGANGLTLMDNETFTITGADQGSSHRIEVRQQGQSDKEYVAVALTGAAPNFTVVPRLAREVEYMASAVVAGGRFFASSPTKATVQFPEATTIAADDDVKQGADSLWNQTKNIAGNGQSWRELGAVIFLDTSTGAYSFTNPPIQGPSNSLQRGNPTRARIDSIPVPASQIDTATQTGKYAVAWFHTHPPDHWRASYGPINFNARPVGPSAEDVAAANQAGMPGFVYDYVGRQVTHRDGAGLHPEATLGGRVIFSAQAVTGGWDLNSLANLFPPFGPTRRRI